MLRRATIPFESFIMVPQISITRGVEVGYLSLRGRISLFCCFHYLGCDTGRIGRGSRSETVRGNQEPHLRKHEQD